MTTAALRTPPAPAVIGRCAVAGCTNSARIRVRVVAGVGGRLPARPVTGLVCARHARHSALGAVLCGASTEGLDPSPGAG